LVRDGRLLPPTRPQVLDRRIQTGIALSTHCFVTPPHGRLGTQSHLRTISFAASPAAALLWYAPVWKAESKGGLDGRQATAQRRPLRTGLPDHGSRRLLQSSRQHRIE